MNNSLPLNADPPDGLPTGSTQPPEGGYTAPAASSPQADSPFLPGTDMQYAWDSTSLGLFKTCPRLYEYTMIRGYALKVENLHLRFGIEFHSALQEYDFARSEGFSHDEAVWEAMFGLQRRLLEQALPEGNEKATKYKNADSLRQLVIDYLDYYENDHAKTFIMANGKPATELSFRFELDFGPSMSLQGTMFTVEGEQIDAAVPFILCGHLDRVVDFNGQLMVLDHKTTTTTLGSYYFDQYEPHNQMSLYTLAGKIVLNTVVKGVIIDGCQIMLEGENRFVRGFTYRTPDQLDEWMDSLSMTLGYAESCATQNYWPMNDTACDKFGGCKFRGICSKSPQVRDKFLEMDFIVQPLEERWNPLKSRG